MTHGEAIEKLAQEYIELYEKFKVEENVGWIKDDPAGAALIDLRMGRRRYEAAIERVEAHIARDTHPFVVFRYFESVQEWCQVSESDLVDLLGTTDRDSLAMMFGSNDEMELRSGLLLRLIRKGEQVA